MFSGHQNQKSSCYAVNTGRDGRRRDFVASLDDFGPRAASLERLSGGLGADYTRYNTRYTIWRGKPFFAQTSKHARPGGGAAASQQTTMKFDPSLNPSLMLSSLAFRLSRPRNHRFPRRDPAPCCVLRIAYLTVSSASIVQPHNVNFVRSTSVVKSNVISSLDLRAELASWDWCVVVVALVLYGHRIDFAPPVCTLEGP